MTLGRPHLMPVVEVEVVLRAGETLRPQLAKALADALGHIFAAPPRTTWIRLRGLAAEDYAENADDPPAGERPVFVSVLQKRRPRRSEMQQEVDRITAAVADLCGRQTGSVHVIYLPDGAGRVAFGGRIVE
jgi:phenylpyruvate tautomerase PptA (4-oxalocrotonate tautomerase family)